MANGQIQFETYGLMLAVGQPVLFVLDPRGDAPGFDVDGRWPTNANCKKRNFKTREQGTPPTPTTAPSGAKPRRQPPFIFRASLAATQAIPNEANCSRRHCFRRPARLPNSPPQFAVNTNTRGSPDESLLAWAVSLSSSVPSAMTFPVFGS
ncbi:hypothetical protein RB9144 [Rhodopirellula baltica SH 1]|uniref:Uncharacterized protein n=1 Tax=Rhodopirellula baltica (strain DSM 10527 / NCIMB 13988 / SH1) TaxID=243090 RepID=Q7UM09_RHOBA|nr:hypothetical protein RB9144 [Rhodopirellula baltica SH 1]